MRRSYRRVLKQQVIWDLYAISYDRVVGIMPYYRSVVDRHVRAMTAAKVWDVMDVGAGTGNVAIELVKAGRCVTAVDLSRSMLSRLRAKLAAFTDSNSVVREQDAQSLGSWQDGAFDGVSILLALFNMVKPKAALLEAIRVLKPGGT